MDSSTPSNDTKTLARRRLLRGSFSVPAVLAVHNGSALAKRSNQYRCIVNRTPSGGGATPGVGDTTLDWVRVARYRKGSTSEYFVRVDELQSIASAAGLVYAAGAGTPATVQVDGTTRSVSWLPWHASGSPAAPDAAVTTAGSVAVLFETTTSGTPPVTVVKVVGFVKEGQSSAGAYRGAATRSCWTSIR